MFMDINTEKELLKRIESLKTDKRKLRVLTMWYVAATLILPFLPMLAGWVVAWILLVFFGLEGVDRAKEPYDASSHFEVYKFKDGEYRWRLLDANRNIVANGCNSYGDADNCERGVMKVVRSMAGLRVWPEGVGFPRGIR